LLLEINGVIKMIQPIIYRALVTIKLYYEAQITKEFDPELSEKLDLIYRLLEIEDDEREAA